MNADIDQAAADWLARRYAGFSAAEAAEFERWRQADPRHALAYAGLEATWKLLDGVRAPGAEPVAPDPDALLPRARRFRLRPLVPALALAAALVVAYLGWWRPAQRAARHFSDDAVTAVGGIHKLVLPDGSVVRLNTDSRVEVRYTADERRVRLVRGEAHFTVAKNPTRPFYVEAGRVAVRAVGTAFNVRLQREAVEVLVTEGQVRVDDRARGETLLAPRAPAAAPLLLAGERAVIPTPGAAEARGPAVPAASVAAGEIERALAWRDRRLEFVSVPLAEIVAEFNRYNRARLSIDDPVLAARHFGGSFRADEPETLVRLLQSRFGLKVERRGDETVLRP